MKIIGSKTDGFILEASRGEVARLLGFYSGYRELPEIGSVIEVDKMYNQLYELSHMEKSMIEIADQLEKYAKVIRPITPISIDCTAPKEI